jgi:SurA N-terminal domain
VITLLLCTMLASEDVVERVVAVVDRQTITLVDVKRSAAIEIAKQVGSQVFARQWPLGFLGEIRTHLVQRTLLLEEARRYSQQEPTDAEVETAMNAFKTRFENDKGFQRFLAQTLLSAEQLRDDIRKSLFVDRFLVFRIRSRIEIQEGGDEAEKQAKLEEEFIKRTFAFMRELLDKADVRVFGEMPEVRIEP